MCGCRDVCMCGCRAVCMCGCVYVCMCGCVDVELCVCVYVCMCGCVDVWMCVFESTYMLARCFILITVHEFYGSHHFKQLLLPVVLFSQCQSLVRLSCFVLSPYHQTFLIWFPDTKENTVCVCVCVCLCVCGGGCSCPGVSS